VRRFVFAGGGTGGHLFPGLAVWERLREHADASTFEEVFVCSNRTVDDRILGAASVRYEPCAAAPPGVRPRSALRFLHGWRSTTRQVMVHFEHDDVVVIAMGGFVAAPVARAAHRHGVPVLLVNLDAVPGKANRYIARTADHIVTAAPVDGDPSGLFHEVVGLPIRRQALADADPAECRRRLGLAPERRTLVVTGASLGAASINNWMLHVLRHEASLLDGWQVVHLTGERSLEDLERAYLDAAVPVRLMKFCTAMGDVWGAADVAISRAGAGSVAEIAANRVPALFLPYPYHRDMHQRANARRLIDAGGGVLAEDLIEAEANHAAHRHVLHRLLADASERERMRDALGKIEDGQAAERVARLALGMGR
jgi:UDP-N-acetylglucosamine--N-acetylmuramyl-(pentapeptide) pyrophosphoryl-undecaprenol N-acetylglucosamine transferase